MTPTGPAIQRASDPHIGVTSPWTTRLAPSRNLAAAVTRLQDALEAAERTGLTRPHRFETTLEVRTDPLTWLRSQLPDQRSWWADPRDGLVLAGVGRAHALEPHSESHGEPPTLETVTGMGDERWRWLFGMAFDGECPRSMEWDAFGPWRAWLPRCSLERIGTETVLAVHTGVNATPRDLSRARDSLRSLRPIGAGPPGVVPAHETRCDSPDHQGWTQLVADATAAIDEGPLEKVVLARKSLCSMGPVDPLHAIPHPSEQPPQTTCFAFEMAPGHVFMGCSPERLFQVDGRSIRTEALAGTRPVYGQPDTDRALGQELLASDKDQREHRHVVDGIREALTELAEWIEVSPSPSVRVLHQVQHLCTIVEAHLLSGVEPTTLLRELHPTPAVCGSPRKEARNFIRNHEPFDRGWYAGPVGWLGPGRAELAVAIRSALFFEGGMHAYAGAGIVDGSDPDSEWSELEAKSRGILEGWARP